MTDLEIFGLVCYGVAIAALLAGLAWWMRRWPWSKIGRAILDVLAVVVTVAVIVMSSVLAIAVAMKPEKRSNRLG